MAILVCRPKAFTPDELDAMLRAARTPKVHDWLVGYVVTKSPHAEELRLSHPGTLACGAPGSLVGNSSADPAPRSRP